MYLADYHMHSRISPDAKYPMTEMAEAALRAGMDEEIGRASCRERV